MGSFVQANELFVLTHCGGKGGFGVEQLKLRGYVVRLGAQVLRVGSAHIQAAGEAVFLPGNGFLKNAVRKLEVALLVLQVGNGGYVIAVAMN